MISEIVELCGGRNVFADLPQIAPPIDVEAVLAADPQVILSTDDTIADPLAQWRRWPRLRAVRARHDLLAAVRPRDARVAAARRRASADTCAALDARAAALRRRRAEAASARAVPPEHFAAVLVPRQHARDHEQQVGQPVEVLRHLGRDVLDARERPDAPLGAARDGAREVAGRRGRAAARQDEVLERRQVRR